MRRALLVIVAGLLLWGSGPAPVSARGAADKPLDAKLEKVDGGKVRLSELRGGPVLLDLWATWCVPCRAQARILEDLAPTFEERGISVYSVDMGEEPKVVGAHLEREPAAYPVLLDRWQAISGRLRIGELPGLVVLRPDGTVAATATGLQSRKQVLALLAGLEAD